VGTNYASLLADLFLYSYEAEFVDKLFQDNNKKQKTKKNKKKKNKQTNKTNKQTKLCSSTIHLDLSMMIYPSTIIIFTIMST
jgi:hypothetical protein